MCVALIATLSGLVMLGIGGVMAGFLNHEQFLYVSEATVSIKMLKMKFLKIVGLVLVGFGCVLLVGGFIFLVIEMVRQKQPAHQAREAYVIRTCYETFAMNNRKSFLILGIQSTLN
jgi:hypothetical protein